MPTNHFKLGLFVIVGLLVSMVMVVGLSARAMHRETEEFRTYFNESVQGLELGSPVKYRGVTIGTVSEVAIAPDQKHVEVMMDLDQRDVRRLHLMDKDGTVHIPAEIRTQLVSQGITGVKFVQMDFFDPAVNPPEELPFPARPNTIPATFSMLKSLEDSIARAVGKLPELADRIMGIMANIDGLLTDFRQSKVSEAAIQTLSYAETMMKDVNRVVNSVHDSRLVERAADTMAKLDHAAEKLDKSLDKISSDKGLLTSVQRATDAYADLGRNANGTNRELERTLREVRETVESIKTLVDALEREPDMLLKGRTKGTP